MKKQLDVIVACTAAVVAMGVSLGFMMNKRPAVQIAQPAAIPMNALSVQK